MLDMNDLLKQSAERHRHLCPRQVLGVRIGMLAGDTFGLTLPQDDKRLFAFVETDGCFLDGIEIATGCSMGRRTLRLMDFGKVAATFIDTKTKQVIRIRPCLESRTLAGEYVDHAPNRWQKQLEAYQIIPAEKLFDIQKVQLKLSIEELIGRPGVRVNCDICGEEIINQREILHEGTILCRACAGKDYYQNRCELLTVNYAL